MQISRRSFLKISSLLGSGIVAGSDLGENLIPQKKTFSPSLGVCTGLQNTNMLADAGYSFIEEGVGSFLVPDRSGEEFIEKLEAAKHLRIPVKACNMFLPGDLKSVGREAVHKEILGYAETAFRRAQMAGVKVIVFGSGRSRRIPDGFSREEAFSQFVALGRRLVPFASRYDVVIALEPLNKNECNFINSLPDGAEIVNAVNHKNFRLLADIYHMKMDGEAPGNIERYGDLICHVHIAEKEGRAAPGTHGEDFTLYFSALAKINYKGMISVESRWEDMALQAPVALSVMMEQIAMARRGL